MLQTQPRQSELELLSAAAVALVDPTPHPLRSWRERRLERRLPAQFEPQLQHLEPTLPLGAHACRRIAETVALPARASPANRIDSMDGTAALWARKSRSAADGAAIHPHQMHNLRAPGSQG